MQIRLRDVPLGKKSASKSKIIMISWKFPRPIPFGLFSVGLPKDRVYANNPKLLSSTTTYQRRSGEFLMRSGHYKLQCASSYSDSAQRTLDRAHYNPLSRAPIMMVHEECTYATQKIYVCKTDLRKKC